MILSPLALVEFMIADARANGLKIIPICPYVKAQFRKHPDWADVMTTSHVESWHDVLAPAADIAIYKSKNL